MTRMVNELRTTVPQPPGVTFKVMRQDDRSSLLVNNVEEMEVLPSTSREEFTVLNIASSKGKPYYFPVNIKFITSWITFVFLFIYLFQFIQRRTYEEQ